MFHLLTIRHYQTALLEVCFIHNPAHCNGIDVIAQVGVKFGMNFRSCSENGNEITRGAAECNSAVIATVSGIYPKISILLVISQINNLASFIKVKISVFKLASTMSSGFLLLLTGVGQLFLCIVR